MEDRQLPQKNRELDAAFAFYMAEVVEGICTGGLYGLEAELLGRILIEEAQCRRAKERCTLHQLDRAAANGQLDEVRRLVRQLPAGDWLKEGDVPYTDEGGTPRNGNRSSASSGPEVG